MIKQALLLFQFLIFLIFGIAPDNVTVDQKVPDTIEPGEEFTVEITINKGDVSGFAKVQQILPEGFTAKAGETAGATFSYSNRKVKFIWMALPSDGEFTINYKITPDENFTGDFTMDGKFAYIYENERKEISIPTATVTVGSGEMASETEEGDEEVASEEGDSGVGKEPGEDTTEDTSGEETTEGSSGDETGGEEQMAEESGGDEGGEEQAEETTGGDEHPETSDEEEEPAIETVDIDSERKIERVGPSSFIVTLSVHKESITGFAKVEEQLPQGFAAYEVNSDGGVFSFNENDRVAKILWMSLPSKSPMKITYKLVAESAGPDDYDISGKFSYLENEDSKTAFFNSSTLTVKESGQETLASETGEDDETGGMEEDTGMETSTEETTGDEGNGNNLGEEDVTSVPSPETGVNYKVQVAASHKNVANDYFRKKYKLRTPVSMIRHEGWNKYLTGQFGVYKQARDRRNEIWNVNNINDAFVTAYNDGNRITVQEALMITNQEWVK